ASTPAALDVNRSSRPTRSVSPVNIPPLPREESLGDFPLPEDPDRSRASSTPEQKPHPQAPVHPARRKPESLPPPAASARRRASDDPLRPPPKPRRRPYHPPPLTPTGSCPVPKPPTPHQTPTVRHKP